MEYLLLKVLQATQIKVNWNINYTEQMYHKNWDRLRQMCSYSELELKLRTHNSTYLVCIDGIINECPHDPCGIKGQTNCPITRPFHCWPPQQRPIVESKAYHTVQQPKLNMTVFKGLHLMLAITPYQLHHGKRVC